MPLNNDLNPPEWEGFDRYFGLHPVSRVEDEDWTRNFRIGAMVGLNVHGSFHETGPFNSGVPAGVYSDGYVLPDQYGYPGYISYFGYQNASQYNAANNTLTFHNVTGYTPGPNGASSDAGLSAGFDLAYGGYLWDWHHIRFGLEFGFGLMPISVVDHESFSSGYTEGTYTYNTYGPLPDAPYSAGPNTGPQAPVIGDTLANASYASSTAATITGTRRLDAILYTFRLGPSFYWEMTDNLGMSVGGGPAMGFISGEYKYDEVITTINGSTPSSGSFSRSDLVWGGDVNATLYYHTHDQDQNVDLYLSLEYMPLSSANFSSGGRSVRLGLQGQVYISAGVSWPF